MLAVVASHSYIALKINVFLYSLLVTMIRDLLQKATLHLLWKLHCTSSQIYQNYFYHNLQLSSVKSVCGSVPVTTSTPPPASVSYTHLRAHETKENRGMRLMRV